MHYIHHSIGPRPDSLPGQEHQEPMQEDHGHLPNHQTHTAKGVPEQCQTFQRVLKFNKNINEMIT